MAIISLAATLSTLNALLAGIPRILYGMSLTRQLPRAFGYLLPSTRAPVVGIAVVALMPILMNVFIDLGESTNFIELILAGVLGWATAYVIIHLTVIILRRREPQARRPFRSAAVPIPQLLGMGLLALAAFKIFPDPVVREHIYRDYGIFLGVAIVLASCSTSRSERASESSSGRCRSPRCTAETELIDGGAAAAGRAGRAAHQARLAGGSHRAEGCGSSPGGGKAGGRQACSRPLHGPDRDLPEQSRAADHARRAGRGGRQLLHRGVRRRRTPAR